MYPQNLAIAATFGGGFLVGVLIGYALKKVAKFAAVVVGLFFAGIACLHILSINWNKLGVSQNTLSTLANSIMQVSGIL